MSSWARDITRSRDYSESTAQEIDREVRSLVDDAYNRAKKIILDNRAKLEVIAKALLEFETLDAAHINEIIETGQLKNPPRKEKAPPPLPPPPADADSRTARADQTGTSSRRAPRAGARVVV